MFHFQSNVQIKLNKSRVQNTHTENNQLIWKVGQTVW